MASPGPAAAAPTSAPCCWGIIDRGNKLVYAGRVGTGFNEKTLDELHGRLTTLVRQTSPFSDLSGTAGQARDVSWVKPELVAEVEFSNWTDDRLLRHPSFQGLREDKPAAAVIRDEPLSLREAKVSDNGHESATAKSRRGAKTARSRADGDDPAVDATNDAEFAGVRLTHPDKVLYADHKLTKRDLAQYYMKVADWMLPHVVGRPLAIVRCPEGSGKPCFFQKHPGQGSSEHIRRVNVAGPRSPEYHLAIDDVAGLISLVQMGVLEIHVWGSRDGAARNARSVDL